MGIQIGTLTIRYYGVIIMLGAVAAAWLATREASRKGQNPETVWDGMIWILIGGIVGARVWHILTPPPSMVEQGITAAYYLTHPLDALAIWRGGLGVPGAVIGGVSALYIFSRKKHLPFLTWLGYWRTSPGFGASNRSLGKLRESGTVWSTNRFALGNFYRAHQPAARV